MHDDTFNPHIEDCKSPHNLGQAQKPSLLEWMSSSEVKQAFHVPAKVKKDYNPSNPDVLQSYKSAYEGSLWIYEIFQKLGYKMMHQMGDTDGILSLPGAWRWIRKLKFKTTKPWTPWLSKNEELIGYVKEWDKFTLVTIHGFGHDGQISRFDESPDLILRFVHDEPLV